MFDQAYDPDYFDRILPPLDDERKDGEGRNREQHEEGQEPPVRLDEYGMRVWEGDKPVLKEDGEIDHSASLYEVGAVLFDAGATRNTIVEALKERDVSLGWEKYADRKDPEKEYHRIVDKLERKAQSANNVYDFEGHKRERDKNSEEKFSFGKRVLLGEASQEGGEHPKELVDDILISGEVHQIFSGGGTGKTFVALWLVAEVVKQGYHVVYLDRENGKRIIIERLLECLGVDPEKADEFVHYYPDPEMDLSQERGESFLR